MTKTMKRVKFFKDISLLITQLSNEGIEMMPFSFYRTKEEQMMRFKEGKSKTLHSKHCDWLAIDLVLVENGKLQWERNSKYERAGALARTLGLTWGGDWKDLNDIYHFEFSLKGTTQPDFKTRPFL